MTHTSDALVPPYALSSVGGSRISLARPLILLFCQKSATAQERFLSRQRDDGADAGEGEPESPMAVRATQHVMLISILIRPCAKVGLRYLTCRWPPHATCASYPASNHVSHPVPYPLAGRDKSMAYGCSLKVARVQNNLRHVSFTILSPTSYDALRSAHELGIWISQGLTRADSSF